MLDVDPFGELLAVEILSPAGFAAVPPDAFAVQPAPGQEVKWMAYDADADALSLVIRRGGSRYQPLGDATMAFDAENRLVRIGAAGIWRP